VLHDHTIGVDQMTPVLCVSGELVPDLLERAAMPVRVVIGDETLAAVARCRELVLDAIASGRSIYGATTGFWATGLVRRP
jgi:histidine ammonia-lyase